MLFGMFLNPQHSFYLQQPQALQLKIIVRCCYYGYDVQQGCQTMLLESLAPTLINHI